MGITSLHRAQVDVFERDRSEAVIVTQRPKDCYKFRKRVNLGLSRWVNSQFGRELDVPVDCILDITRIALISVSYSLART